MYIRTSIQGKFYTSDFSKASKSSHKVQNSMVLSFRFFLMAKYLFLFIRESFCILPSIFAFLKEVTVLHKILFNKKVNKKVFQMKIILHTKIMWDTKNYVVPTKKYFTSKRNTFWQKVVHVVYRNMLHWLKKFFVSRNILWYRTKIKFGVHKYY